MSTFVNPLKLQHVQRNQQTEQNRCFCGGANVLVFDSR